MQVTTSTLKFVIPAFAGVATFFALVQLPLAQWLIEQRAILFLGVVALLIPLIDGIVHALQSHGVPALRKANRPRLAATLALLTANPNLLGRRR
ncbi:hypothetical protein J2T57_001344 [Natronocella acetinitrilica]|uniref:Uncharacterized protein n=1 Tax=Natronocella acetinitrilica TaxID=414046 RepID=A0AAE3KFN1_9GAMM|nr:hypothetical protein [Natronocella acetinitrilica]MCP1674242.1 hypothetical protein [Natronocella acetinitrilica]